MSTRFVLKSPFDETSRVPFKLPNFDSQSLTRCLGFISEKVGIGHSSALANFVPENLKVYFKKCPLELINKISELTRRRCVWGQAPFYFLRNFMARTVDGSAGSKIIHTPWRAL